MSTANNSGNLNKSGVSNEHTQVLESFKAQAGYATIWTMKKQTVVALILLLLIPAVLMLGGLLFSLINPEIAAGHPNYVRSFHLLSLVKNMVIWASEALVAILWLLACFLVIRSKERSPLWLFFAALGPIGFAILTALNDKTPSEVDRHARFVRRLNIFVRVGYEVCRFVIIWLLAYQAMVLKRNLMIMYQSATTGISTAQIIDQQNASSGMWAFAEGMEVMYLVVFLYLIWPIVFNIVGRVARRKGEKHLPSRRQPGG
jgi:hypothetical protein